jgi:hypothetical protein
VAVDGELAKAGRGGRVEATLGQRGEGWHWPGDGRWRRRATGRQWRRCLATRGGGPTLGGATAIGRWVVGTRSGVEPGGGGLGRPDAGRQQQKELVRDGLGRCIVDYVGAEESRHAGTNF